MVAAALSVIGAVSVGNVPAAQAADSFVNLTPAVMTYTNTAAPTTIYSGASDMVVSKSQYAGYLKFDTSKIAATSTIVSAELTVSVVTSQATQPALWVAPVDASSTFTKMSYSTRPALLSGGVNPNEAAVASANTTLTTKLTGLASTKPASWMGLRLGYTSPGAALHLSKTTKPVLRLLVRAAGGSVPVTPSAPIAGKTFAVWHHVWEGPNLRAYPASVQTATNLIILGIAQGAGNGAIGYGPANGQSVADHASDIRAAESRGTRVSLGFGGAGDSTQITNDTQVANFVASVDRLKSTYGFSGVDVDLEPSGSSWTQPYLVKALKQLETRYGTNFNIGVTVGLYGEQTAKWLSLARALGSTMDYMAPMLYDFPEARDAAQLKSISLARVQTMIDGGVPVEKQLLGYMLIPKGEPGYSASTPQAIRDAFAAVRVKYPTHRGLFIWEDKLLYQYGWSPVSLISPVVR